MLILKLPQHFRKFITYLLSSIFIGFNIAIYQYTGISSNGRISCNAMEKKSLKSDYKLKL